jgi:mannan endo-1,4-beta-mannosidase
MRNTLEVMYLLRCMALQSRPASRKKRFCTGLALVAFTLLAGGAAHGDNLTLEAESATLVDVHVSTAVAGYSGTGYVTGFTNNNCKVHWDFTATAGLYDLLIRFRSPFGEKGFGAIVNGLGLSGMFPQTTNFAAFDAGLVELLEIGGGWNWSEIDRVDLISTPAPAPPLPVPTTLADPRATFAARMLMQALVADYGKHTWAGQHDASEIAYIQNTAGRKPLIVEGDLIDYSPSRVQYQGLPAHYTEDMIALEPAAGHVLSFCWHWNAPTNLLNTVDQPWWKGFYSEATTFDLAAALANTNSTEYALILRDIDAIAVQLQKVASNNIPVLWRPLHESEGGWFWWGAKGPEPFKQLWRLLFDRLTVYHGLHNLIWVLTSSDPAWYPGDDVVDVVGLDGYPDDRSDALSPQWETLKARFDGKKLIALTEFGGVPDVERMHRFGVWWSWFSPWGGSVGPTSMPADTVIRIYQSPEVITVDELNAVPPQITGVTRLSGGAIELMGTGPRGSTHHILTTTDLALPMSGWTPLATGTFSGGVFTYTDTQLTNDATRFYSVSKP